MLEVKLRAEDEMIQNWKDQSTPVVSICCITYNHEEYIEDSLKGFLMQETEFPFEILIHDDASLDNTAEVIRRYQKKYPKIIKPVIQIENQYSKRQSVNLDFNLLRAKGRFIAMCEGDDYWIDSKKLAKQVNFLEKNTNFIATYHNVNVIDENGDQINKERNVYGKFSEYIYTLKDAEKLKLPSQTASLLYRNIWRENDNKLIETYRNCKANGDLKLAVLFAIKGNVYCMSDTMAVHRKIYTRGNSWSATNYKKNITLFQYSSLLEINKFAHEISEVKLKNKNERLNTVLLSFVYLLKKPSTTNLKIFNEILKLNEDSLMEVFIHISKKVLKKLLRK